MSRMHGRALVGALVLGVGVAGSVAATAQAAGIDDTFGVGGTAFTPFSQPLGDRYLGVTRGPGGGTYAVGYTTLSGTDRAMALARVGADGELVAAFGSGGVATVNVVGPTFVAPPIGTTPTGAGEVARGVVVQSDGKIVISGQAETQQSPAPPDSRDTDVYVARFLPSGLIDTTFGVNGVRRVDLAPSTSATTANPTGDQAWGLGLLPGDKLIVNAGRGIDPVARPGRTDRDLTAIQLTRDGALDPTFKGLGQPDGISSITATAVNGNGDTVNVSENARQPVVQPDGKVVLSGYSSIPATVAGSNLGNRPFIARFNTDGTLDSGFGTAGIGSGQPLGVSPSFSEVYDIGLQGNDFVLAGYGQRASEQPANGIDLVAYRFDQDGILDPTFGTGGATTYNQSGGEDRARDLVTLPDGRVATTGSTVPGGAGNGLNGLVFVLNANGTPDTTVSPSGTIQFEFGGPSDGLWGSTLVANGTKLVAAGYCGAAAVAGQTNGDNAVQVRVDLTAGGGVVAPAVVPVPAASASATCPAGSGIGGVTGPTGPQGPIGPAGANGTNGTATNGTNGTNGATGPAGPAGPGGPAGVAGERGPAGPAGSVATIRVSCKLTGKKRNKISCTVRRASTSRGAVRVRVARAGRVLASGQALSSGKSAVVQLSGAVRAGRYTVTTTLPSGRHRTKVTQQITLR